MNDKSPQGSESSRGFRDTARRRRDAEEKLQQHLLEARDHVPNEYSEAPETEAGTAAEGDPGPGQRDKELA